MHVSWFTPAWMYQVFCCFRTPPEGKFPEERGEHCTLIYFNIKQWCFIYVFILWNQVIRTFAIFLLSWILILLTCFCQQDSLVHVHIYIVNFLNSVVHLIMYSRLWPLKAYLTLHQLKSKAVLDFWMIDISLEATDWR